MTRMIKVYGIPNCDTVKKARAWLQAHGHTHHFHDFKKLGAPAELLSLWAQVVGWEALVNKKGTTWRQLPPDVQATVVDQPTALAFLQSHTSAIKRPVVQWPDGVTVGFNPDVWATRLT